MSRLIKDGAIVEDRWSLLREATVDQLTDGGAVIVPLALWLAERRVLLERGDVGVWLKPDDDPDALAEDCATLPVIAVDFPQFTDGRGYSTARLLRDKLGFAGELRAIGDVLRDQLHYLRQCGFNAFTLRADRDPDDALRGLRDFSDSYQASTAAPLPLFRRRAMAQTPPPGPLANELGREVALVD